MGFPQGMSPEAGAWLILHRENGVELATAPRKVQDELTQVMALQDIAGGSNPNSDEPDVMRQAMALANRRAPR